jgi:hypothetical protein
MTGGDSPAEADAFSDASRTSSMGRLWNPRRNQVITKKDTIGELFESGMGVAPAYTTDKTKSLENRKS